jgi:RimJ/RimL family protein N-acetyltransferase
VSPSHRGKGYGKEMLRLGTEYVKEHLTATRIDLGVFENNESARHCYESVGFKRYAERISELPIGTWKCIDMEMFLRKG